MPLARASTGCLQPKRRAPNPRPRQADGKESKPVCRGTSWRNADEHPVDLLALLFALVMVCIGIGFLAQ